MTKGTIIFFKWMGIISLVFLAGCPAPSDSAKDNQGGGGGALEPGVNLTMSISTSDEISNKIPTNDNASVEIIFLDAAKIPLSDRIINVSATAGTLSQASVLTDPEGKGTVTISSPVLATGTAPGIFTATPVPETDNDTGSEVGGDEISEEAAALIEKVNQPVSMNYEFVATTVAETPDEAATFVSSLQFVSADPTFLSLKGTGGAGYGEISRLVFKVVDNESNPIEGVEVNFTLTTTVGGLALNADNSLSNAQGEVSVTVLAGTVSTPVKVTASVTMADGTLRAVQSDLLTVTTGIPDENSFSLSREKAASEALGRDGEEMDVTARLADRYNNPVPDGTVVNFTTEGGAIGSSCETVNGACTVVWISQAPRPLDGRSTILAYAIGHETFYDHNGSGIFDDGDTFDDLGEKFRDDDETNTYNPTISSFSQDEILIDYDENGIYTIADGVYNGVPCNHSTDCPVDANNIAGRSNLLVNVSSNTLIIMASSSPNMHLYELLGNNTSCLDGNGKLALGVQCQPVSGNFGTGKDRKNLWVLIEDVTALCKTSENGSRIEGVVDPADPACIYVKRQSAPTDSAIAVSTAVGKLIGSTPNKVPDQIDAFTFRFTVEADDKNTERNTDVLVLSVTLPASGTKWSLEVTLSDPPL